MPFWTLFAIFAVATVALILLRPNPRQEARKPRSLKDVNFPRSSNSDPVPLILGTVRMDAPNTIWADDFGTDAGRVARGSRHFTNGDQYYLGFDMALGLGPDCRLKAIYVDKKVAWNRTTSAISGGTLNISVSLGEERNGGFFRGTAHYYSGSYNQSVDSYVAQYSIDPNCVPAYNGVAHIVFEYFEVGESPQLRKLWFIMECRPSELRFGSISYIEGGYAFFDINPAEAIWQILTHPWRGLNLHVLRKGDGSPFYARYYRPTDNLPDGKSIGDLWLDNDGNMQEDTRNGRPVSDDIDVYSLLKIGATLNDERLGISLQVLSESKAEEILQEIINTINGISYQDIETGKISFSLIRENDVPKAHFTKDDVINDGLIEFSRSSWSETFNQVKITYSQVLSESEAVAVDQDMGSIGINGVRSTTLSFPMVHNPAVAQRIAARELAEISVPLHKINIELERNAVMNRDIRPGDIITITYDPVDEDLGQWSLFEARFRVLEYDFGKLTDGKIILKCLQDSFAYELDFIENEMPFISIPSDPDPVTQRLLVRVPNYFTGNGNDMDCLVFAASPGENWNRYDYNYLLLNPPGESMVGLINAPFDQIIIPTGSFLSKDEIPVSAFSHAVFPRANSITDFMNRTNPIGVLTNGNEFIGVTNDRVYRGLYGSSRLSINSNRNEFYYVDLSKRVSIDRDDLPIIAILSRFITYFSGVRHDGYFAPQRIIFDRKFLAPQRLRWSGRTLTWRIPDPRSTAWIDDNTPDHVFTETWFVPNPISVEIFNSNAVRIQSHRLNPAARSFTFSNLSAGEYYIEVSIPASHDFRLSASAIPITVT